MLNALTYIWVQMNQQQTTLKLRSAILSWPNSWGELCFHLNKMVVIHVVVPFNNGIDYHLIFLRLPWFFDHISRVAFIRFNQWILSPHSTQLLDIHVKHAHVFLISSAVCSSVSRIMYCLEPIPGSIFFLFEYWYEGQRKTHHKVLPWTLRYTSDMQDRLFPVSFGVNLLS